MAEVTGQPPVEYQSVSQPTEGQATAWAEKPQWGEPEPDAGPGVAQTLVAEFIGTFALVAVGVTTWYWMFPDLLAVGLATGLTVAVLVTAFNRLGSGQFNPAITLGLLLGGRMKASRAMMIIPVQIISAVLACFVLSNFLGTNEKMNWIKTGPINEETGQVTATMKSPVEAATPGVAASNGDFIVAVTCPVSSLIGPVLIQFIFSFVPRKLDRTKQANTAEII